MKKKKIGQRVYRLPPIPAYDIAGMENWLADMAKEGLFLEKDGFFAGVATFIVQEPQKVKYRLEAAQKQPSLWNEDGTPDEEAIELNERYSWEYVTRRGDFFIYRSSDPSARELNTDPAVQALALNAVKRRKREAVIYSIFSLVIYPILLTRGCPLMLTITMGTVWTSLLLLSAVLFIAEDVRAFLSLKKVQRALKEDGYYVGKPKGKQSAAVYFIGKTTHIVLVLVLVCALLRTWGVSVTKENKVALAEYAGDLPFATIRDFAGEGSTDYTQTMQGMNMGFNTIEEKHDLLAPRSIDYNEEARVKKADGSVLDGGLYVEYYEMRSDGLAKQLTREIYRFDKRKKRMESMETPTLSADFAVAYRNEVHFPTILLRKGSIVVKAYFHQSTGSGAMGAEEWMTMLCDSVGNN